MAKKEVALKEAVEEELSDPEEVDNLVDGLMSNED